MEQLPRDGRQLTAEQKAAILEDVPELAALLDELKGSLTEVRTRIGPLVREVSTTHRIKLMLVRSCTPAHAPPLAWRLLFWGSARQQAVPQRVRLFVSFCACCSRVHTFCASLARPIGAWRPANTIMPARGHP